MYCRNYTGTLSHVLCREVYCTVFIFGSSIGGSSVFPSSPKAMFLRFQFPKYRATEGIGRIQIFLEAVQEDPDHPDTYLPAEHTADFEVVMATVAGTAQGQSLL